MDIELLEITEDERVLSTKTFNFSSEFFLRLSKSDFSKLGLSVKRSVVIDGESAELKLCELSEFIRESIVRFLEKLLVDIVNESFDKLGPSPSKEELQEYTYDLKELPKLIKSLQVNRYSHLKRTG